MADKELEYIPEGEATPVTQENSQSTSQEVDQYTRHSLAHPEQVTQLAKELKNHVEKNNLTQQIAGKSYVLVEAWQYIGRILGFVPTVLELNNLSSYNGQSIYKYQAKVALCDMRTGQYISTAWAICSNEESKKRKFDEYAIASMAQTRAIGKVCRNVLGFLASVGESQYEATPAEEMEEIYERQKPTLSKKVMQEQIIPAIKSGNTDKAQELLDSYQMRTDIRKKLEQGINKHANQDITKADVDFALSQSPEQKSDDEKQKAAEAIKET